MRGRSQGGPVALLAVLCLGTATGCTRVRADVEMHDGAVCFHGGDFAGAVRHYSRATELSPSFQTAWLNLAYSYWSLVGPDATTADGKRAADGAVGAFHHYIALHEASVRPGDPEWLKADETARGLMVQMWEESKSYAAAIGYFEDRLKQNPRDDLAMLRLGELNVRAGNWPKALEWYKRRAELNASASASVRADIYYTIGTACYERLHNHPEIWGDDRIATADEGLDALQQAMALRPEHGPTFVYINLLWRERALGEVDPARRLADMQEAEYNYAYAKVLMTRGPAAASAGASQPAQHTALGRRAATFHV